MAFKWTPDMEIGDALIDAQHQGIFLRVNRLLEAMMAGGGTDEVREFAGFLQAYIVTHFEAEERAMREATYPGLERHAEAHAAFRRDFACLLEEMEDAQGLAHPALQVQRRVCDWLINHIGKSDRDFADFMRSPR